MAFKFFLVVLLATAANAGYLATAPAYAAPLAYAAAPAKAILTKSIDADYDPNPQYSYAYDVQDSLTGDFKSQQESRNGDIVQGSYSLLESDGTRRIVDYTADPANGFNAVVRKEPAQVAVKAVAAAPIAAYAAPAITKIATPIAHAKIAAPIAYAAPAAYAARAYAPAAYAAPAAIAAPAAYATPLAYAAPAAYAARAAYAAPAAYAAHAAYAAPAYAKIAAPAQAYIGGAGPLSYISHVSYSTPLFSYSH